LIVVSQTRDNLGFGFDKKTRSGGKALRFYATLEIWSSIAGTIKKTVRNEELQLGIKCQLEIKKNRLNGKLRSVEIPILHSYGIDDLGSCVDYLVDRKHWSKTKQGIITAEEFDFEGRKEALIKAIHSEGNGKGKGIHLLRSLVGRIWNEIEDACELDRPRRY
jgi:hypothetical protein